MEPRIHNFVHTVIRSWKIFQIQLLSCGRQRFGLRQLSLRIFLLFWVGGEGKISRKCSCFYKSDWRGSLLTGFDWQPCAAWLNAVAHKSCADNVSPSLLTTQVTAECVYALLTWHRCSNCTLFYTNYQLCWLEWVFISRGRNYCQLGCLKNRPLSHLVNFFPLHLSLHYAPRLAHAAPSLPFFPFSNHSVW